MKKKVVAIELRYEEGELNREVGKLNAEGWKVESVSTDRFSDRSINYCDRVFAYLLCTKVDVG